MRVEGNAVSVGGEEYTIPFLKDHGSIVMFLKIFFTNLVNPSLHFADMLFVVMDAVQSSNSNYVSSVEKPIFVNRQESLSAILSTL